MKKIIFLLAFLLIASSAFSQIKLKGKRVRQYDADNEHLWTLVDDSLYHDLSGFLITDANGLVYFVSDSILLDNLYPIQWMNYNGTVPINGIWWDSANIGNTSSMYDKAVISHPNPGRVMKFNWQQDSDGDDGDTNSIVLFAINGYNELVAWAINDGTGTADTTGLNLPDYLIQDNTGVFRRTVTLADDDSLMLLDAVVGECRAFSESGDYLSVIIEADATVTEVSGVGNHAITDSDTDLCIYPSPSNTYATVRNRLGSAQKITIVYTFQL